jgi:hypothetical protein
MQKLAEALEDGTHFTTISKLERDVMTMSLYWADKLSYVLNIGPLELVSGSFSGESVRLVPMYARYGYRPDRDRDPAARLGLVPTIAGGPNTFALGFIPAKRSDDITASGYTYVIDPDRDTLDVGVMYAVYVSENRGVDVGIYKDAPARFELADRDEHLIVTRSKFTVVGTIIFECRAFEWA